MRYSKHSYNKVNDMFRVVTPLEGVCSAITLSGITRDNLKACTRDELQYYIIEALRNTDVRRSKIGTVQITLNAKRSWCWGTPWKFAYSYEGNNGHCSVFYINFED